MQPPYAFRPSPDQQAGRTAHHRVVIVGAGPVGLSLAIDLALRGVASVVLEAGTSLGAGSRAICYAKRSLEILDRLGVGQRMLDKGVTWQRGKVFWRDRMVYAFDLLPEPGHRMPAFVNLQQYYLEQFLIERAQELSVDLRFGHRLTGVAPQDDGACIQISTLGGDYALRCDWLLACDGVHSTVRHALGLGAEGRVFHDHFLITDVRMEADFPPERWFWFDPPFHPGQSALLHSQPDNVWRIDLQLGRDADPEVEVKPERVIPRLKAMLGENRRFELLWTSIYTFRCRRLTRFRHGRVIFLGDAAHQVSPFGARGFNGGIQDADNLAWKLALVLQGRAHSDLVQTYEAERHYAARDNTESATRSAIFIGPESDGQRLFRNAILDLAQRHAWARPWVNVGRLSVATLYADSPLNREKGEFASHTARPGAAAPDGRFGAGFFVDELQGAFAVAWFGSLGPKLDVKTIQVDRKGNEALFERYGVKETATYVFRPDGHVLARCTGIDAAFAQESIRAVLEYRGETRASMKPAQTQGDRMSQADMDRLYDELAALVDRTPKAERENVLARLVVALAQEVGSYAKIKEAIDRAKIGS